MTDKELIESMGGAAVFARILKLKSTQQVYNWISRGIPSLIKVQHPEIFFGRKVNRSRRPKARTTQSGT